jgi:hypothetical protein
LRAEPVELAGGKYWLPGRQLGLGPFWSLLSPVYNVVGVVKNFFIRLQTNL